MTNHLLYQHFVSSSFIKSSGITNHDKRKKHQHCSKCAILNVTHVTSAFWQKS